MKELKKLSLKEEVDREAQDIEKEVERRYDLGRYQSVRRYGNFPFQ